MRAFQGNSGDQQNRKPTNEAPPNPEVGGQTIGFQQLRAGDARLGEKPEEGGHSPESPAEMTSGPHPPC
jgi:hypothetical protein